MKVLFTDLDGTLLTDDKRIPEKNRDAIHRMCEAGHKIVLASGRSSDSVLMLAERLELTVPGCYIIGFNGAQIVDAYTKERLYRVGLPFDTVRRLFAEGRAAGLHVQTFDDERVVAEEATKALETYCRIIEMENVITEDAAAYLEGLGREPSKILVIDYEDHEKLEAFRQKALALHGDVIDAFYSNPAYMETVRKGVNKGNAVRKLCELLHVSLSDTVGAGDAMNDLPLLKTCGTGCAMVNGDAEVKEAADYVTTIDNNAGGVAEIIEKFILT